MALLKVAERPCEIQSNPVPMEKGNGLSFWIRAAVEGGHPGPRIHVLSSSPSLLQLAGPPLVWRQHREFSLNEVYPVV